MEHIRTIIDDDKPRHECGVFGVCNHVDAASLAYFGIYALQHRGQESAGITVMKNERLAERKGMGLVSDVFTQADLEHLEGDCAIGHVRYSTTGSSIFANAQPFMISYGGSQYAIGHNGNIVNAHALREDLERVGSIFQTTMDSEIFLHLFVRNLYRGFENALVKTCESLKGAFSFVMLTSRGDMVGIKDPHGFHPLCLGLLDGSYVLASETCALDLVGAEFIRELEPGEIVIINRAGIKSIKMPRPQNGSMCVFEFVYFARPDSVINGLTVYDARKAQGRMLAKEAPVDADLVMPFPDSGIYAAIGYSQESCIPFEMGMIKNHYVGRTFIQPTQSMRDFAVRIKLNPVKNVLKGKEVIIVDDSIVRGTTSKKRIRALRELGVKKVHMRVASPMVKNPCHYGVDFPTKTELIATTHSEEDLRQYLGLDTLHYLTIPGLMESTGVENAECKFCKACFDGVYPVAFEQGISKSCLEI